MSIFHWMRNLIPLHESIDLMHMTSQKGAQARWGSNVAKRGTATCAIAKHAASGPTPASHTAAAAGLAWARALTERLSANALCQHNTCAQRDKSWPPTWRRCYGDVTSMHMVYTIRHLCCTTPQMLTKLNEIDKNIVPWMSQVSFFFSLLAKYSQRATNTYFIHKTILVLDKIARIHTNTQRKVICDIMHCYEMVGKINAWLCNGTICCTFSSHRLVHNKLTRCCTILTTVNSA